MKIKLLVMFGGKSVEHEVSVISALQAIASLDQKNMILFPFISPKITSFTPPLNVPALRNIKIFPPLSKKANAACL